MDSSFLTVEDFQSAIQVTHIPEKCKFWMVRANSGVFFDEFVEKNYVAIGWNAITQKRLDTDTEKQLQELIAENYPNISRPITPVNKCRRFIEGMDIGDIVMLVGNQKICFAVVGEYYEENDPQLTVTREKEVFLQIQEKMSEYLTVKCPYVKRRHITLIKTLEEKNLNPNLAKALSNHHSLSSLEMYSKYILDTCFDLYSYLDNINLVFRVTTDERISGRAFSRFSFYTNEAFCLSAEHEISITTSLNSPGDYVLIFADAFEFVQEHWISFIVVFFLLFGGRFEIKGCQLEFPSVLSAIKAAINHKFNTQMKKLELEEKKAKVESLTIENERKKIELQKEKDLLVVEKLSQSQYVQELPRASKALKLRSYELNSPNGIVFPVPPKKETYQKDENGDKQR